MKAVPTANKPRAWGVLVKFIQTLSLCVIAVVWVPGCAQRPLLAQARVIEVWEAGEPVPWPSLGYAKQSMHWHYQQVVFFDDGDYVSRSTWRSGNAKPITREVRGRWRYPAPGGVPVVSKDDAWIPIDESLRRVYRYEAPPSPFGPARPGG